MTNDELKAAWAADITTYEQFLQVHQRTRNWLPRSVLVSNVHSLFLPRADTSYVHVVAHRDEDVWPLKRDIIREAVGYYPEPTTVLKWLRNVASNIGQGQMYPHISPQDRMQIAFTPDANQAKLDRKQRMSIGRYLRKVLLFVPDAEIQRLEQQHRSELDTEFLLAETVDAIREVYMTMDGDSGCMRYDKSNFNHDEFHPSAVYCSPGMGVAYTVDENDVPKSRSVVWVNPEDAKDKRYVRIYGDPILKKKLEANGFRMAGLVGAKLRIYRDPSFTSNDTVVMPWIDPAGGIHAHNVDRSFDSEHAIRFKGEEFFTMVSGEQKVRYERAGIHLPHVQTQSGHVEVPEVDTTQFIFTCPLSSLRTNRMETETQLWIDENGAILRARSDAISNCNDRLTSLNVQVESRMQRAYCRPEVKEKYAIPGYQTHFNNEDTRNAVGVCELDKAFYPDSERWYARNDCVPIANADGTRTFIKKDDALMMYAVDGNKYIHLDMVRPLKKDGCVPVAVLNGFRGIAHKDHPRLAVTRGGKRVIQGQHDVVSLHDGSWEYSRNVATMNVAGISLTIHKDDAPAQIVVTQAHVRRAFEDSFRMAYRTGERSDNFRRRDTRILQKLANGFQGGQTYMRKDENIVACDYYNKATLVQQNLDAARGILAMQEDAEWCRRTLGYNWPKAVPWAKAVVAIIEDMNAFDREYDLAMAEANAVEAAPTTQAVIEHLNTLADSDMDRLIAEVDDTLATAVVRRWPRLSGSPDGMGPQRIDLPTTTDENGAVVPVQVAFTPHMDVPIAHPDRLVPMEVGVVDQFVIHEQAQGIADDDLLAQLASVGLAPIVIDESTVFPNLNPTPTSSEA